MKGKYTEFPRQRSVKYQKNFFVSADDAEQSAWELLRRRARFYVWETEEGLFEWTAIPEPLTMREPWTLVKEGTVE